MYELIATRQKTLQVPPYAMQKNILNNLGTWMDTMDDMSRSREGQGRVKRLWNRPVRIK